MAESTSAEVEFICVRKPPGVDSLDRQFLARSEPHYHKFNVSILVDHKILEVLVEGAREEISRFYESKDFEVLCITFKFTTPRAQARLVTIPKFFTAFGAEISILFL